MRKSKTSVQHQRLVQFMDGLRENIQLHRTVTGKSFKALAADAEVSPSTVSLFAGGRHGTKKLRIVRGPFLLTAARILYAMGMEEPFRIQEKATKGNLRVVHRRDVA